MRRFYLVTNHESHDSELVLADGHVDALSYYRRKHRLEPSTVLSCSDFGAYNNDERFPVTKLSELQDGSIFYKVDLSTGTCVGQPMWKLNRMANGKIRCRYLNDTIRPDSYFNGSTKVTLGVKTMLDFYKNWTIEVSHNSTGYTSYVQAPDADRRCMVKTGVTEFADAVQYAIDYIDDHADNQ